MLEAPTSSLTSVLQNDQNSEGDLVEIEFKFSTNNVKLSSSGNASQQNIFDFDRIICWFLILLSYLFVALEEADYQVLSASLDADNQDTISDDSWSLMNLFSFFRR